MKWNGRRRFLNGNDFQPIVYCFRTNCLSLAATTNNDSQSTINIIYYLYSLHSSASDSWLTQSYTHLCVDVLMDIGHFWLKNRRGNWKMMPMWLFNWHHHRRRRRQRRHPKCLHALLYGNVVKEKENERQYGIREKEEKTAMLLSAACSTEENVDSFLYFTFYALQCWVCGSGDGECV